jgi:imidazolonepropionase
MKLIGPFSQIIPLTGLPLKGALADAQLTVIDNGAVVTDDKGNILSIGDYNELRNQYTHALPVLIYGPAVLLPGFIDCHTHICFDGNRSRDYAMRIAGKTYLEIARAGGGIWDSVTRTRAADIDTLITNTAHRANRHLQEGVTTIEVKSGYGLSVAEELKMLQAIRRAGERTKATLISTCLAAHMKPKDYTGVDYLDDVVTGLFPAIQHLTNRVDIFIEETAFSVEEALPYLQRAKELGFALTVHADQFSSGGSAVAVQAGASSADHLEASTADDVQLLAGSDTVAVVLPGASLGLGMHYAPARKLLDAGACVAIASDWNPGSAPMGDLLLQAAVMSAAEKLSTAEVLAGLTFRAAKALDLTDRGRLAAGMRADMQVYPTADYRDLLYYQGKMKPSQIWKAGEKI